MTGKYTSNIILWLLLIGLTLLAFIYAGLHGQGAAFLIVAIAGLKFLAIGFQFMEARHAHIVWPAWLVLLFSIYSVGVLFFGGN